MDNKRGGFEVRESRSTPKGPRSRTLATFKVMSDEVIRKARERTENPPDAEELREAALRVGAPVAEAPVDRAGRELLRLTAHGTSLDPMLRRLLLDALGAEERRAGAKQGQASPTVSDAARAATQWIGASLESRGEALRELLDLADALPFEIREDEIQFPRLRSA